MVGKFDAQICIKKHILQEWKKHGELNTGHVAHVNYHVIYIVLLVPIRINQFLKWCWILIKHDPLYNVSFFLSERKKKKNSKTKETTPSITF